MSKRKSTPQNGNGRPDRIHTIPMHCLVCFRPTGKSRDFREPEFNPAQFFSTSDQSKWKFKEGLCPDCKKAKNEGCILVFSDSRGLILRPEARKHMKKSLKDDSLIKVTEDVFTKIELRFGIEHKRA